MSNRECSVLVAGGTGFIGGALLRKLTANGFQTTALAFADRHQAERLPALAGLAVLSVPSAGPDDLRDGLSGRSFDYVINLVSGGVRPGDRGPANLREGNLVFLTRLLEAVAAAPPKLFLHAGSWSEYAPPDNQTPIPESHPLQFGAGYGGAKSLAERDGSSRAAGLGIPFATLRLFHVYGPGEPEHRLTPYLISSMAAGREADLSPGDQVRDFVYVDDVADAFIAALSCNSPVAGGAYNLCSGIPVTVRRVVETLAGILEFPDEKLRFGALPPRPDEPAWVVGDKARFEKATGWRPNHTLAEGLEKTVTAFLAGDNDDG